MLEVAVFILLPLRKAYFIYGEGDLNTPRGIFFFNLRLDFLPITTNCLLSKSFF